MTAAVPPDVRLLIARWPDDAPRGAVTEFCRSHGSHGPCSTSSVPPLPCRACGKCSTRSPARLGSVPGEPIRILPGSRRAAREVAGRRVGPWPVECAGRMLAMGLAAPSRATLARIFTRAGVVRPEPRKKPRSAYRRFVYPAPNCCWQIDATGWTLANGRGCVTFQVIDDHSRYALASLVAADETSDAAVQVVQLAIGRHGVPQKSLSDNGSALNPSRRGREGRLVRYLRSLGVERSPASLANPPPKARTNASTRPCTAT